MPSDDHDRRHDQAGDRDVEQEGRAGEALAKAQAGQEREGHRQEHHDQPEPQRPLEAAADVTDRLRLEHLARTSAAQTPCIGKTRPPLGPWNESTMMVMVGP